MTIKNLGVIFFISVFLLKSINHPQSKLSFEFGSGFPYNFSLPLTIKQLNEPDIKLNAKYNSEPFTIPIYWIWRVGLWNDNHSWELEAIHHKIFLDNKPEEVDEFSISHGLNFITINHGWLLDDYIIRLGVGVVIAHPESKVRGKKFSESGGIFNWGYFVSGPAINFSAAKRFYLLENLSLNCEAKLNASYSNVPLKDGEADVYNLVFQLDFLFGYDLELL